MAYRQTRFETRPTGPDSNSLAYYLECYSDRTPKGAVIRKPLRHKFIRRQIVSMTDGGINSGFGVNGTAYPSLTDNDLYNLAYARLVKKVKGSNTASLGVTLGTWRQSAAMIQRRLFDVVTFMKSITDYRIARDMMRDVNRDRKGRKKTKKRGAADTYLEGTFGWQPLFQDIHDSMKVLGGSSPQGWISGRANRIYDDATYSLGNAKFKNVYRRRCSVSCRALVANPNTFLLNQLGLINPATVMWDLIPWSFVVGMFVNVNQMISSMTDFVGLDVSDVSVTWSLVGQQDYSFFYSADFWTKAQVFYTEKERTLHTSVPKPHLALKCPDLSLSTLLMASALAVQQATRILGLIDRGRSFITRSS